MGQFDKLSIIAVACPYLGVVTGNFCMSLCRVQIKTAEQTNTDIWTEHFDEINTTMKTIKAIIMYNIYIQAECIIRSLPMQSKSIYIYIFSVHT